MPHIGHRELDIADLGISPAGSDPVLPQDVVLERRIRALVTRVARDRDDRELLLEALGVQPTLREEVAAAG